MNEKLTKQTILIVDDSHGNIVALSVLFKSDYNIIVATSGREAIEVMTSGKPPSLILLDVMMPDMSGYDVCKKLKAENKFKSIPIIFITAMDREIDETIGFQLGAEDYIKKPFYPAVVVARVRTHLELKYHRDHLEKMVKERTAKLEKAKMKAQAANDVKSQCLENVSHELRTLMTGFIGMTELLMETALDNEQREYTATILSSAYAQLKIIDDILTG